LKSKHRTGLLSKNNNPGLVFFKLIIWNIDIHTCLLDSTFLCPHLYFIIKYILYKNVSCWKKSQGRSIYNIKLLSQNI
jgi:hypothetical protein